MSKSSRQSKRLHIVAAALGVGIGVMTGQGIAIAEPGDSSGPATPSDSTTSSTADESDAGQGTTSTSSSSSSSSSSSRSDADDVPLVGGNGLSRDGHTSSSSSSANHNGSNSSIAGGNGLSNADASTPEPETAASTPEPEPEPATSTSEPESGAETTSGTTEPETTPSRRPADAGSASDPGRRTSTETAVTRQPSAPDAETSTVHVRSEVDTVATDTAIAVSDATSAAEFTPSTPQLTSTSQPLTALPTQPRVAIPDVAEEITPAEPLLVQPVAPPPTPNPGPAVPPLAWAFVAWARRGSDTARELTEAPPAESISTSLALTPETPNTVTVTPGPPPRITIPRLTFPSTGIPGVDALLAKLADNFNRTYNNAAPTATASTPEQQDDGTVTGTIDATDLDGDTIKFTLTQAPTKGTVHIDQVSGAYTYTPTDPTRTGTDSHDAFVITLTDGKLGPLDATTAADEHATTVSVELEIVPATPNHAPGDVTYHPIDTDPDTGAVRFTLTATDPDPGDTVTITATTDPANGELAYDSTTGVYRLTPSSVVRYAAGAGGTETVTIVATATDRSGATSTTPLDIVVLPTNTTTFDDVELSAPLHDGALTLIARFTHDTGNDTYTTHYQVVDTTTGKAVAPARTQPGIPKLIVPTPDGTRAVLVSYSQRSTYDYTTHFTVVDLAGDEPTVHSQPGNAERVTLSPDGTRAIVGSYVLDDATIEYVTNLSVVDTTTGRLLNSTPLTHPDITTQATFSPDGRLAVLSGTESEWPRNTTHVTVVDTTTGTLRATVFTQPGLSRKVVVSADGTRAVVTSESYDGTIGYTSHYTVIDTATGNPIAAATSLAGEPRESVLDSDVGRAVVTSVRNGTISFAVIDTATGESQTFTHTAVGNLREMALTPDGSRLVVTSFTYVEATRTHTTHYTVIDTATGRPLTTTPGTLSGYPPSPISLTPDGKRAIIVGYVTTVADDSEVSYTTHYTVVDTDTGRALTDTSGTQSGSPSGAKPAVAVSADGTRAVIVTLQLGAATHTTYTIVDTATGASLGTGTQPGFSPTLAVSPVGTRAVVTSSTYDPASNRTTIQYTVVDTATGKTVKALAHSQIGSSPTVTFSPDGTHAVVTSRSSYAPAGYTTQLAVLDLITGSASEAPVPAIGFPEQIRYVSIGSDEYLVIETDQQKTVAFYRNPAQTWIPTRTTTDRTVAS